MFCAMPMPMLRTWSRYDSHTDYVYAVPVAPPAPAAPPTTAPAPEEEAAASPAAAAAAPARAIER
jgi:hypothetical protein